MSTTPREDGFAMPPEWEPHQLTLMAWPCRPETFMGPDLRYRPGAFEAAKEQHAGVANAVVEFEPVLMLVRPEHLAEARRSVSAKVELLPAEFDDCWMRDNGPTFVRHADGSVALVQFDFNGWGELTDEYARDARVPAMLASHLGVRRYVAPMILEGGSFFTDGAGTLLTTEQCLLHENRNPQMSREEIEATIADYLGIDRVLWLGEGHYEDYPTDGHVDDIAHFLGPGRVFVHAPSNPAHPDLDKGVDNLARIAATPGVDAIPFDTGAPDGIPYLNLYVCNGGVVVPIAGTADDEVALEQIRRQYPDRTVATVRAEVLFHCGGGGPHCITQQVPAGPFAAPTG
jgi:agmatine deiminase